LLFVFTVTSEALTAAVDIFYERLVADEQLKKFFDGISVIRLKVHQKKFLTLAFTEIPTDIDVSKYMIDKHARLFQEEGLNGTHFDLVAGHLVATLQQMNVSESLIGEVVSIVGPLRPVFADEADRILNESK
jgi:hemoglobin